MKIYTGKFFDGQAAIDTDVSFTVKANQFIYKINGQVQRINIEDIYIETPLPECPLIIELSTGARIECEQSVYDKKLLKQLLNTSSNIVYWFESNKLGILISLLSAIVLVNVFSNYGVPFVSKKIAMTMNQNYLNKMDKPIMNLLDNQFISKSDLPQEKQKELVQYFKKYSKRNDIDILFRDGKSMGANAFALSGKTVIFTDQIVKKVNNKKLLLTIYLHEEGHLVQRHLFTKMVSTTIYNVALLFIVNDMVGITESLANAGVTLISLKNSRANEISADRYSMKILTENNISPKCFGEAFSKFTMISNKKRETNKSHKKEESDTHFLSTHPGTMDRIQMAKELYPESSDCEYESDNFLVKKPIKADQKLLEILKPAQKKL